MTPSPVTTVCGVLGFVTGLETVEAVDAATLKGLYEAFNEAAAAHRVGAAVISEDIPRPPLRIAADHEWQLLVENTQFWPPLNAATGRFTQP